MKEIELTDFKVESFQHFEELAIMEAKDKTPLYLTETRELVGRKDRWSPKYIPTGTYRLFRQPPIFAQDGVPQNREDIFIELSRNMPRQIDGIAQHITRYATHQSEKTGRFARWTAERLTPSDMDIPNGTTVYRLDRVIEESRPCAE